jgi:hypothetical protein
MGFDHRSFHVRSLVQRSVASLYAHLVTRPTGRAVRLAIEGQLGEGTGRMLSVIDLSEVTILDFSCADEVVAKLLLKYGPIHGEREAFFVLKGVRQPHRDQIEVVLERHGLSAVAETGDGQFELLRPHSDAAARIWALVESEGVVALDDAEEILGGNGAVDVLDDLASRHLVFRRSDAPEYHALSSLVKDLLD